MVDFEKLLNEMKQCKLHCELCQNGYHDLCDSSTCECEIYNKMVSEG